MHRWPFTFTLPFLDRQATEGPKRCRPSYHRYTKIRPRSHSHPPRWPTLVGHFPARHLQTVHDSIQMSARSGTETSHRAYGCCPSPPTTFCQRLNFNMSNYDRLAFSFAGPYVWNLLCSYLRQSPSVVAFNRSLKTFHAYRLIVLLVWYTASSTTSFYYKYLIRPVICVAGNSRPH